MPHHPVEQSSLCRTITGPQAARRRSRPHTGPPPRESAHCPRASETGAAAAGIRTRGTCGRATRRPHRRTLPNELGRGRRAGGAGGSAPQLPHCGHGAACGFDCVHGACHGPRVADAAVVERHVGRFMWRASASAAWNGLFVAGSASFGRLTKSCGRCVSGPLSTCPAGSSWAPPRRPRYSGAVNVSAAMWSPATRQAGRRPRWGDPSTASARHRRPPASARTRCAPSSAMDAAYCQMRTRSMAETPKWALRRHPGALEAHHRDTIGLVAGPRMGQPCRPTPEATVTTLWPPLPKAGRMGQGRR